MKTATALLLLHICYISTFGQSGSDTISVYFDLNSAALNATSKYKLDSLAYNNALPTNEQYGIVGYADYIGNEQSNNTLSQLRANNVAEYLITLGIAQKNIQTITGKGEVSRSDTNPEGYPQDRRVDMIIGGFKPTFTKTDPTTLICKCGKPNCKRGPFVKSGTQTPNLSDTSQTLKWQIFFKEATLLEEGMNEVVNSIAEYLKEHPGTTISLSGYNIGDNETVLTAVDRAEYIRWRLEQYNSMNYKVKNVAGYGKTLNIEQGKTEGYYRRVDIYIHK